MYQAELIPDLRRPVPPSVNTALARICGMLHGVARRELALRRRDPERTNWALGVAGAAMSNYGKSAKARIISEVYGRAA